MDIVPSQVPLRHRSLWLAVGWGLVLLVIYLSLTPMPPRLGVDSGDKIGHLAAYAGLMGWFAQLYPGRWPLALGFVALGAILEVLQGLSGFREASLLDMLANCLGVGLGWLVAGRLPNVLAWFEGRLAPGR